MNAGTVSTHSSHSPVAAACWSCGAASGGGHFCASCGKIQPLPAGVNYFGFFGLPRKLGIGPDELELQFHQLSWKLHPDNFARASEYERNLSLDRSSQLNDAYRTLQDPVHRVEYLLGLAGMRKEGQQKQQAPPELLEEVFELNESLDELREARRGGGDAAAMSVLRKRLHGARENFRAKLSEVDHDLERFFGEWDRTIDSRVKSGGAGQEDPVQTKLMERMNEALNRRSYIRNLVDSVERELAEA
jgi:molecular chaperone HscB